MRAAPARRGDLGFWPTQAPTVPIPGAHRLGILPTPCQAKSVSAPGANFAGGASRLTCDCRSRRCLFAGGQARPQAPCICLSVSMRRASRSGGRCCVGKSQSMRCRPFLTSRRTCAAQCTPCAGLPQPAATLSGRCGQVCYARFMDLSEALYYPKGKGELRQLVAVRTCNAILL